MCLQLCINMFSDLLHALIRLGHSWVTKDDRLSAVRVNKQSSVIRVKSTARRRDDSLRAVPVVVLGDSSCVRRSRSDLVVVTTWSGVLGNRARRRWQPAVRHSPTSAARRRRRTAVGNDGDNSRPTTQRHLAPPPPAAAAVPEAFRHLSLIHISEPTRPY